jgi:hypothetical protein
MMDPRSVNWSDPKATISRHFTVREAIWLNGWGRLATSKDGLTDHVKAQICVFAEKMDAVREFIGSPIVVHRWWGPALYNAEVGGRQGSKHLSLGDWSACDFHANIPGCHDVSDSCQHIRAILLPKLEEWGLRMEKNGLDAPWVHLDNAPVLYTRYFKP